MILMIGVGAVGKSVINYYNKTNICFYDDIVKKYEVNGVDIPFFSSWEDINLVVVSPGFSKDHAMVKAAVEKNIKITTDISIFLNKKLPGITIGITGTNGKSTMCFLLKHILGELASIGGNFGESPINFDSNNFYILELSSYQLEWLSEDDLKLLDVGIITNISKHHLSRHGTFKNYTNIKHKILNAKKTFYNVPEPSKVKLPKNIIFDKNQYKHAWPIICEVLDFLDLDIKHAAKKLESYVPLKFRQEVIMESPLVVNDSKATNSAAMHSAVQSMQDNFILICNELDFKEEDLKQYSLLKKIFILTNNDKIDHTQLPYSLNSDFNVLVTEAAKYAKENGYQILFSPGKQSFEFLKILMKEESVLIS